MKPTTTAFGALLLLIAFSLGACASREVETTTRSTTTATGAQRTTVTRDLVPAEGNRKIPVTESY
jgi:hypothetical protein